MVTRLDDALIHQNYGTLDNVVDSDPRWFDRFYMNVQAIDGSFSISQGTGVYPNMQVMDGFGILATPDLQVNVRASRELINGNRDEMVIGPLHAEILEPMKRWHFWLDENEHGISYDFTYTADFKALEPKRLISVIDDRRVWDWTTFGHVGRVDGWAKLDNRKFDLTPQTHWAIRDRSWGVRPGIAKLEDMSAWIRQANWGSRYNWVCIQLESFYLWYLQTHEEDGTPRYFRGHIRWKDTAGGAEEGVAQVVRRLKFESGEHFQSAEIEIHLESGRVLNVFVRRLPTTVHLRGGNYGGFNGIIHGMNQGPLKVTGERWEPVDSRQNEVSLGMLDHIVEATYEGERGYGIFELSYGT